MPLRTIIYCMLLSLLVLFSVSCTESQLASFNPPTSSRMPFADEYEFLNEVRFGGIHTKNSDWTEPRAIIGKQLKVIDGGVVVLNGKDAGFYLKMKLNNKIDKNIYIVTAYDNPLDKNNPYVNDMTVTPDMSENTLLLSSPDFIKGIKFWKTYKVKVTVYENKSMENKIDEFTQKLRSYVDTTRPRLRTSRTNFPRKK